MKKIFMISAMALAMTSAYAQYTPEKGSVSTEVSFDPFGANGGKALELKNAQFKVRYFFTDRDAFRVKLGFGVDNTTDNNTTVTDANGSSNGAIYDKDLKYDITTKTTETVNKQTSFAINLGYERHFDISSRLAVYAGAELGYTLKSYSGKVTENENQEVYTKDPLYTMTANKNTVTEYDKQNTSGTKNSNYFVASVFTGIDFYVYKGLYLGAELGISFETGSSRVSPSKTIASNWTGNSKEVISTNITETVAVVGSSNYDSNTGVTTYNQTKTTTTNGTVNTQVDDKPRYDKTMTTENKQTKTSLKFYVEPAIRLGWTF